MTDDKRREHERDLAAQARARGEPIAWFEELYAGAENNPDVVPWADLVPNRFLVEWLDSHPPPESNRRTLVVGCGLGDDAEELSVRGYDVTAFDISPAAVAWCKKRFPNSRVDYQVANLLEPPADWRGHFPFIVEIYTIQALWPELRSKAINSIVSLLAPGGDLFLLCSGREPEDDPGNLPFPLTKQDLVQFRALGLQEMQFEDLADPQTRSGRRFRVHYRAPS